jgi:phospholipase C
MKRRRRAISYLLALLIAGLAVAASTFGSVSARPAAAAAGSGAASSSIPIKHVVVLLEENHSFDNVLGKFCAEVAAGTLVRPGKNARCDGATSGRTSTGTTVPLASAADYVPFDDHSVVGQQRNIDGGKMDGFSLDPNCSGNLATCYSQFDPLTGPCTAGSCIPNYAALAKHFTVSDRTFESYASPSWAGHLVWATATQDGFYGTNPISSTTGPQPLSLGSGWGCDSGRVTPWGPSQILVPSCVPNASGSLGPNWAGDTGPRAPYVPTIFDELAAKGLSWKIYGGAGAPPTATAPYSQQGWQWAICPTFAECLYTPQRSNLTSTSRFLTDAASGALPSYSIITPTAADSQHNNNDMSTGDNYIGNTIAAIEASPDWKSTAVFVTYDDCGCFYDHVNPLQYSATWGIRVPMVIVSPWAKLGYSDSTPTTFAGTLSFVEHLFGLAPLTTADATAYDYRGSFCFNPATNGCVPAGPTPVKMTTQKPSPMAASQRSAQVSAAREDT